MLCADLPGIGSLPYKTRLTPLILFPAARNPSGLSQARSARIVARSQNLPALNSRMKDDLRPHSDQELEVFYDRIIAGDLNHLK
jgi:hypothetical protein